MSENCQLELNPFAIMTPQCREDVARCIEECHKELAAIAGSMAPPDHRIRSSEALFFTCMELLQETVCRLLCKGRINENYTFLSYAWWEMRHVRVNALARHHRLNAGEECHDN